MGEEAPGGYYDLEELDMAEEDEPVMEWETGLPGCDELTPLSQPLVPPGLAAAFRIPPEPGRTLLDVHRASAETVSRLRRVPGSSSTSPSPPSSNNDADYSSSPATAPNNNSKRARLVWTPQLHRRFVEVVAHLGIKSAVPKTIMQLMNVEGLTRENVASHLQKYRLYVKRMHGGADDAASASDYIFASAPVPPPPSSSHHHRADAQPPTHGAAMYHHPSVPMMGGGGGGGGGVVTMNSGHHHQYHQHSGYSNGYGYGSFPQYYQQHGSK